MSKVMLIVHVTSPVVVFGTLKVNRRAIGLHALVEVVDVDFEKFAVADRALRHLRLADRSAITPITNGNWTFFSARRSRRRTRFVPAAPGCDQMNFCHCLPCPHSFRRATTGMAECRGGAGAAPLLSVFLLIPPISLSCLTAPAASSSIRSRNPSAPVASHVEQQRDRARRLTPIVVAEHLVERCDDLLTAVHPVAAGRPPSRTPSVPAPAAAGVGASMARHPRLSTVPSARAISSRVLAEGPRLGASLSQAGHPAPVRGWPAPSRARDDGRPGVGEPGSATERALDQARFRRGLARLRRLPCPAPGRLAQAVTRRCRAPQGSACRADRAEDPA